MTLDEIVDRVAKLDCGLIELTGGEPLLQPATLPLMTRLADLGKTVLLETSGALDIGSIDSRVIRIVDLKCPSSGESTHNRWENINLLRPSDELKFVIGTVEDYDWAKEKIERWNLPARCTVLFSWVHPLALEQRHLSLKQSPQGEPLTMRELAERLLRDKLTVRFQLQMHKYIWEPTAKGV